MKYPVKQTSDFEACPVGNHLAVCNAVVDLGLQPGSKVYPDPKHQVYIRFELPDERVTYQKDGQPMEGPMSIGRTFTASMSQKSNLRKFLESWRGAAFNDSQAADFDLKTLLGKCCLLNVTHTERGEKTYANITAATPLPKSMKTEVVQHNTSLYFDLNAPDDKAFHALPQWLQEKIGKRIEVEQHTADPGYATSDAEPFNDEIPF